MKRRIRLILLLIVSVLLLPQPLFAADSASTKLSKLMTELWMPITIKDGWIYYLPSFEDQTSLYRMHTDGTGKQKVNLLFYLDRNQGIFEMFEEGSFFDQLTKDKLTAISNIVGERVYYYRWSGSMDSDSEYSLYRIKKDGTQETKLAALNDEKPLINGGVVAIQDDWVYIEGFGKRSAKGAPLNDLYRVSTKGGQVEKIIDGYEKLNLGAVPQRYNEIKFTAYYLTANGPLAIKNGYIYYANSSDNFYLYRSTLDGKSKQKIASKTVAQESIIIDSDIVYFNTTYKQGRTTSIGDMYRVGVNGTNLRKLGDGRGDIMMVHNGWAYFLQGDLDTGSMSRMRIDGSGKKKLTDYPTVPLGIYGDYMKFVKYKNGSPDGDYRMKLDGSEKKLLNR
ncbi:DUF5050 domain-containing protein [Cohnella yongneupensis]|uniref:DUF5050 domain-containing protein n=1 Tax=Cohnella yongneupensis TaxID=425006 RepID=A0ABW0QWN6_9BACL